MRTDNLPSASNLSLTDEIIGNFSNATEKATMTTLLALLSPNIVSTGTATPTSSTEGAIYIMTDNGNISKVYGLVGSSWKEFP